MSAQYRHIYIYYIVNRNKKNTSKYIFHFSIGCFLNGDEKYYTATETCMGRHYGTAGGTEIGENTYLYLIIHQNMIYLPPCRDGTACATFISGEGTLLRAQFHRLHETIGKQNDNNSSLCVNNCALSFSSSILTV